MTTGVLLLIIQVAERTFTNAHSVEHHFALRTQRARILSLAEQAIALTLIASAVNFKHASIAQLATLVPIQNKAWFTRYTCT